ncbi:MAG: helix-turn-helix transcriptional regulator [Cyanobium sp.]
MPRDGGRISTGYLASIKLPIDHRRLSRTMRAMHSQDHAKLLTRPLAIQGHADGTPAQESRLLYAFVAHLDCILREGSELGAALGLDEELYRVLALAIDQRAGTFAGTQRRWQAASTRRSSRLDDLVDYIRANTHLPLTFTDMEEQSHYSARHLQSLFRETFACSPMQFLRRQRLSAAMEKLRHPGPGDSVTSIARACGYRFLSSFSTDFQRHHGIAPSQVLRRRDIS